MARLFVAVLPPENVAEELATLPRKDQRGVRFAARESWHVTLRFLGEADIDAVVAAMDDATLPPAVARLGPGVDVMSERALVVPVQGLDELAEQVRVATEHLGQQPRRRFRGHLTLARLKPHVTMPPAMGAFVQTQFEVHEVALVQSHLEPHGARYTTLATWPVTQNLSSA